MSHLVTQSRVFKVHRDQLTFYGLFPQSQRDWFYLSAFTTDEGKTIQFVTQNFVSGPTERFPTFTGDDMDYVNLVSSMTDEYVFKIFSSLLAERYAQLNNPPQP